MTTPKPSMPRRRFLRTAAALLPSAVVCGSVPLLAFTPPPNNGKPLIELSTLRRTRFTKLVGQQFSMTGLKRPVKLVLQTVSDLRNPDDVNRPANLRKDPFSLMFKAPQFQKFASDIYRLSHPSIGRFDVFIQAVRADDDSASVQYEVVFN